MAGQSRRQVAFDVACMVAGLAPVTDSAGNVAIPKAELTAELAAYFRDSLSVESFMELAYGPASGASTVVLSSHTPQPLEIAASTYL